MGEQKREKISGLVIPVSCKYNSINIYMGFIFLIFMAFYTFLTAIGRDVYSIGTYLLLNISAVIVGLLFIKLDYDINAYKLKKVITFTANELNCGIKTVQGFADVIHYESDSKVNMYISFINLMIEDCNSSLRKINSSSKLTKKDISKILVYKYLNFITLPLFSYNIYAFIVFNSNFSSVEGFEIAMFCLMNVLLSLIAFLAYSFVLKKIYEKFGKYMNNNNLGMFANKEIRYF